MTFHPCQILVFLMLSLQSFSGSSSGCWGAPFERFESEGQLHLNRWLPLSLGETPCSDVIRFAVDVHDIADKRTSDREGLAVTATRRWPPVTDLGGLDVGTSWAGSTSRVTDSSGAGVCGWEFIV